MASQKSDGFDLSPEIKSTSLEPVGKGDDGIKAKEFFQIVRRQKWLVAVVCALALTGTALHHYANPSYSVKAYLLVDSDQENTGFQALLGSLGLTPENSAVAESETEKNLLILRSNEFYRKLAEAVKASADYSANEHFLADEMLSHSQRLLGHTVAAVSLEGIAQIVRGAARLSSKNRGIIELTLMTRSPRLSAFLANVFLDEASKHISRRDETKLVRATSYIQKKIDETIGKMEGTDQKIVTMNTKNAPLSMMASQGAISDKLLELKAEWQNLKFQFEQNEKIIVSLSKRLPTPEPGDSVPANGGMIASMGLPKTLANLKVENELLKIRIETLQSGLKELVKSNLALPKVEQLIAELKRQKGLEYHVFDNLYKTHLQLEVKGLAMLNRIYPLATVRADEAFVTTKLAPKMMLLLLLSFSLSIFALYGFHFINPVVCTKKDFDGLDISFLGSIPEIHSEYLARFGVRSELCHFDVDSRETVAFKQIRSRLMHLSQHSGSMPRKVVSILSFGNSEGKSFVSSNLGACFAWMGKKTLLIDFDLRRGSLSKVFNVGESLGLCNYFDEKLDLESLVQSQVSPNLDILPAGKIGPTTTEKISNQSFTSMLEYFRPKYDFIIIDTAPLLVAHESNVVAKEADFAVLMATSWKTKREYIEDAIEQIRQVRLGRVHFILNKAQTSGESLVSNYYYMKTHKSKPTSRVSRPQTQQFQLES